MKNVKLMKLWDKLLKEDFWLLFLVLSFFVFVCSGYFIRSFVFGFYYLERELISTVAFSIFISLPLLMVIFFTRQKETIRAFHDLNHRFTLNISEKEELHKTVIINMLFFCSRYEWVIIFLVGLDRFIFEFIPFLGISKSLFVLLLFFIFFIHTCLEYWKETIKLNKSIKNQNK